MTAPVGNDYTGGSCCPPMWTYRPGDPVYAVHPGGAGSWREVQPEAPAWTWLGEAPREKGRTGK